MPKQKSKRPKNTEQGKAAAAVKRKRHKRNYMLYYLMTFILLLAAGTVLSLTVFFRVESVVVEGNTKYANGDLIDSAGITNADNLFRVPTWEIEERLCAQFPYVSAAKVRRVLPATIVIEITQAVVDEVIETSEGYLLIDKDNVVLEHSAVPTEAFFAHAVGIDVSGAEVGKPLPEEYAEPMRLLRALHSAAEDANFSKIDLIDVGDPLNLRLLYDRRLIVEIGSELDLDQKLQLAWYSIENEVEPNFVGTLDVSVRPTARIRHREIFDPAVWPFPQELLADYGGTLALPEEHLPGTPEGEAPDEPSELPEGEAPASSQPPASSQAPSKPVSSPSQPEPSSSAPSSQAPPASVPSAGSSSAPPDEGSFEPVEIPPDEIPEDVPDVELRYDENGYVISP